MLAKILLCLCYVDLFESKEENKYVKYIHFHCKCEDEHEYFVYTCKAHPFMYPRLHGMKYKCNCNCKNIGPFETCDFCVQMRYLINFRRYTCCVEKIPNALTTFLVPLDNYLGHETTTCESFFILKTTKFVEI